MRELIDIPASKSGRWKRHLSEAVREITGMAYCNSCQQSKPVGEVKTYRPANPRSGVAKSVVRCDACQARRVAYLKGRKV